MFSFCVLDLKDYLIPLPRAVYRPQFWCDIITLSIEFTLSLRPLKSYFIYSLKAIFLKFSSWVVQPIIIFKLREKGSPRKKKGNPEQQTLLLPIALTILSWDPISFLLSQALPCKVTLTQMVTLGYIGGLIEYLPLTILPNDPDISRSIFQRKCWQE